MMVSFLILGAALAAGGPAATAPPEARAPALLVVEHAEIDLGAVVQGQEAVATFVLRNEGPSPVRILRAAPS
jgi:hypothetical protein